MRYSLIIVILLLFLSTCSKQKTVKVSIDLPDSIVLEDVISSVISIDSLWTNHNLNSQIKTIKLYNKKYFNGMQIPFDPFSVSYEELYSWFNSNSDSLRKLDSVYLTQQISNFKEFKLSDSIVNLFNRNDDSYYEFYMPLLSHDQNMVYIFYTRECGPLCGTLFESVLIRKNGKWIRKHWDIIGGR